MTRDRSYPGIVKTYADVYSLIKDSDKVLNVPKIYDSLDEIGSNVKIMRRALGIKDTTMYNWLQHKFYPSRDTYIYDMEDYLGIRRGGLILTGKQLETYKKAMLRKGNEPCPYGRNPRQSGLKVIKSIASNSTSAPDVSSLSSRIHKIESYDMMDCFNAINENVSLGIDSDYKAFMVLMKRLDDIENSLSEIRQEHNQIMNLLSDAVKHYNIGSAGNSASNTSKTVSPRTSCNKGVKNKPVDKIVGNYSAKYAVDLINQYSPSWDFDQWKLWVNRMSYVCQSYSYSSKSGFNRVLTKIKDAYKVDMEVLKVKCIKDLNLSSCDDMLALYHNEMYRSVVYYEMVECLNKLAKDRFKGKWKFIPSINNTERILEVSKGSE